MFDPLTDFGADEVTKQVHSHCIPIAFQFFHLFPATSAAFSAISASVVGKQLSTLGFVFSRPSAIQLLCNQERYCCSPA